MAASRSVPGRMGPWWALWVLLSLPKALRGQVTPQTALSSVLQTFQKDQVRGCEGGGGRVRESGEPCQPAWHPHHGDAALQRKRPHSVYGPCRSL